MIVVEKLPRALPKTRVGRSVTVHASTESQTNSPLRRHSQGWRRLGRTVATMWEGAGSMLSRRRAVLKTTVER